MPGTAPLIDQSDTVFLSSHCSCGVTSLPRCDAPVAAPATVHQRNEIPLTPRPHPYRESPASRFALAGMPGNDVCIRIG